MAQELATSSAKKGKRLVFRTPDDEEAIAKRVERDGGLGRWSWLLLTCTIVESIKQGKEGADGKDVIVLMESHLD